MLPCEHSPINTWANALFLIYLVVNNLSINFTMLVAGTYPGSQCAFHGLNKQFFLNKKYV